MTLFGWDTSHYDGTVTLAVAQRARDEGIVYATAKIGEGTGYDDPADASNLGAFKAAGVEFLGGYYVVRSGTVTSQVSRCISLADRDELWWRTFPGWFWQVDLELWSYDKVPAATGVAFGKELRRRTGKTVVLYASRGQYGSQLSDWDGPLWNAHYPSSRQMPFRDLYPGDGFSAGWSPYSGKTPSFLQYASSATIGGLTTCDANAFRGTLAELRTLITGHSTTGDDVSFEEIIDSPGLGKRAPASQWIKEIYQTAVDATVAAQAANAGVAELKARPAGTVTLSDTDRAAIVDGVIAQLRGVVREEIDKTRLAG